MQDQTGRYLYVYVYISGVSLFVNISIVYCQYECRQPGIVSNIYPIIFMEALWNRI